MFEVIMCVIRDLIAQLGKDERSIDKYYDSGTHFKITLTNTKKMILIISNFRQETNQLHHQMAINGEKKESQKQRYQSNGFRELPTPYSN